MAKEEKNSNSEDNKEKQKVIERISITVLEKIRAKGLATILLILFGLSLLALWYFQNPSQKEDEIVKKEKQEEKKDTLGTKKESKIKQKSVENTQEKGLDSVSKHLLDTISREPKPELTPEQKNQKKENIQFFERSLALRSNESLEVIYPKINQSDSKFAFQIIYSGSSGLLVSISDSTTAYQALKENLELFPKENNLYISDTLDLAIGTYYYKLQRVDKKLLKIGKFYIKNPMK